MKTLIKKISTPLKIVIVAAVLVLGTQYVLAEWHNPGCAPTGCNEPAPINVSASGQIKDGGLTVAAAAPSGNIGFVVANGNAGIGVLNPTSYKLQVNGDIQASAFYYSSDRTQKKNIAPLQNSLSKIISLQGVSFNWKDSGKPSVGLIAQDVEKIYPELVNTDSSGKKSVEYANIVGPLIEAIKEQQKQIDQLKLQVQNLQNKK